METKIHLEPIKMIYVESENGPQGAAAAFTKLEKNISLKGRRFYGVVSESGKKYLAASAFREGDERLGLTIGEITGGSYIRTKINNWQDELGSIVTEFNKLAKQYPEDTGRPRLEFYRSQKDLYLLLPTTN